LRRFVRILSTIALGLLSLGLTLLTLMVARDCWLLLGKLYLPSYALFNLADKALVLVGGIVALAVLVYAMEMYTASQTFAALVHHFLRVSVPMAWILGACHLIMAVIALALTPGTPSFSAFLLPLAELAIGTGLHFLNNHWLKGAVLSEARF